MSEPKPAGGRRDMRRHDRAPLEFPVVVTDAANRVVGGIRFEGADLSAGGAFLRSDLLFEVGESLKLEFQLPDGRLVRAESRVARVSRGGTDGEEAGMGLAFDNLADGDRKAIEAALAARDA